MKNAKKILLVLLAIVALTLVMSISVFAAEHKVATHGELTSAISKAAAGDTIVMTADINCGTTQLAIDKAITLDLGGHTLTTGNNWGGMSIKGGPSIKNGKINHVGKTSAMKVWNAGTFENLDIECSFDPNSETKTIGGIVLQEGSSIRIDALINVKIYGRGLTNGIETYNCGNSPCVIGSMDNVTINATNPGTSAEGAVGIKTNATIGTMTNCDIYGANTGIFVWSKSNYKAAVDLEGCAVSSGSGAAIEIQVQNSGSTVSVAADSSTTLESESGVAINNSSFITVDEDDLSFEVPGYDVGADGEIESKACETHNYVEFSRTNATCTAKGSITYKCSACSETQIEEIPATGHNYVEDVTKRVEPTANEEGSKTLVCSNCNDEKTEVIPKLEYTTYKVSNSTEFDNAYNSAVKGDVILLTADFSIVWKKVEKGITIDLGGHTLTCTNAHRAFMLYDGASIINGKIIYTGNVGVIQIYSADRLEDLEIEMTCNIAGKTVTGITLLSSKTSRVNSIKNVTIKGPETSLATIVGIETYLCGDAVDDVIGSMENVTIDVQNIGMKLIAPVGTATNCTISGGDVGILIGTQNNPTYTSKINLVGCTIEGGNTAVSANVTGGTINFAADSESSFTSDEGTAIDVKSTSDMTFTVPGYVKNDDGSIKCVNHSYVESDRVDAQPGVAGSITYTCSGCGDTYSETIEALPEHTHTEVEIPAVLPLPSNNHVGKTAGVKCAECGEVLVAPVEFTAGNSSDTNFKINSAAMVFGEEISLVYSATHPTNSSVNGMYMVFIFNGEEYPVYDSTHDSGNKYKFYFLDLQSHLLDQNIEAYVYAIEDGKYVMNSHLEYSGMQYIINQLKKSTNEDFKSLLLSVLNLCATIQKNTVTGITEEELITSKVENALDITVPEVAVDSVDSSYNVQGIVGDRTQGYDWKSGSVAMGSSIKLKLLFTATEVEGLVLRFDINGERTIEVDASELTKESDGRYAVYFQVMVLEYDKPITCTFIKDGEQVGSTLTYSVYTYIYRQFNSTSASVATKEFVKAIYAYTEALKKAVY